MRALGVLALSAGLVAPSGCAHDPKAGGPSPKEAEAMMGLLGAMAGIAGAGMSRSGPSPMGVVRASLQAARAAEALEAAKAKKQSEAAKAKKRSGAAEPERQSGAAEAEKQARTAEHVASDYNRRGVAAGRAGRRDEELLWYSKAIKAHPPFAVARVNRAGAHLEAGRYAEAYHGFMEARKLDPATSALTINEPSVSTDRMAAWAALSRGRELRLAGRYAEAEAWATRAIEADPTYGSGFHFRGKMRFRLGKRDAARLDLDRFLEYDPRYKPLRAEGDLLLLDSRERYRALRRAAVDAAREEASGDFQKAFQGYARAYALAWGCHSLPAVMKSPPAGQRKRRSWLGIWFEPLRPDEYFGLGVEDGLRLVEAIKGGPADTAGIKKGDVLLEINGSRVGDAKEFRRLLDATEVGATVPVKVLRGKEELVINVTLGEDIPEALWVNNLAACLVRCYRKCPAKPELPEAARRYRVMAETTIRERGYKEAVELLDKALLIAPWWPAGHYNRARILAGIERYPEAVQGMKWYLRIVPDAPNARAVQDKIYEWEAKRKEQP